MLVFPFSQIRQGGTESFRPLAHVLKPESGGGCVQHVCIEHTDSSPRCDLSDDVNEYGQMLKGVIRGTWAVVVQALVMRSRNPNWERGGRWIIRREVNLMQV